MTVWSRPDQAERFIREYADPILRVCAAYSLGRADAQDICQDIFLTLLEREQAFQDPEHERAFILRCAINASKDLQKQPLPPHRASGGGGAGGRPRTRGGP